MSVKKKIIKTILTLSLITSIPMLSNLNTSYASTNAENELKSVIQKYDINSISVQEGIAIKIGESLDLSQYPNWELSNDDVVKIENGILKPIKQGTVFLSQQIDDKAYILEVYVFEEEPSKQANTKVNRDYYKVFIDPGHGGSDPGNTTGSSNGMTESVINLKVSTLVKQKLEAKGIEVKMSRTGDTYPTLEERAKMANNYGADVFVSIHQNSAGSTTSAHGIETFHHTNKSSHKPLSTDIQNNMIKETNAKNRGVKDANFAVLRLSSMPSALAECGFMTNSTEYSKLISSSYQNKLATGIANGIEKYLNETIVLENVDVISTGTVTIDSLNVRAGYGTSHDVIGTLSKGSKVDIVESKNGWYKIIFNGKYGYVSGSYIEIDETISKNGWVEKEGKWYYYHNGIMKIGWLNLGGTWYYLNSKGEMLTGWQQVGNKWYYLSSSGAMQVGWLNLGGTWYYLNSNGEMLTGWQEIGNKWYYLSSTGAMQIGWLNLGGTWYYLKDNGEMLTGWQEVGNKWYYLSSTGAMQIGWLSLGGTWYYLKNNGEMLTGWQEIGNKWYYMYDSGKMAINTVIDGYKIDSNGVATPII